MNMCLYSRALGLRFRASDCVVRRTGGQGARLGATPEVEGVWRRPFATHTAVCLVNVEVEARGGGSEISICLACDARVELAVGGARDVMRRRWRVARRQERHLIS